MNTSSFCRSAVRNSLNGRRLARKAGLGKYAHNRRRKAFIVSGALALSAAAVLLALLHGDKLEAAGAEWQHSAVLFGIKLLLLINISVFVWRVLLVCNRKQTAVCEDHELPLCTVVIPAYNEGRQVLNSLRSVARSEYPKGKLQIVCVDDGSRDDTWRWMLAGRKELGSIVELVRQPRNKGKRHALYEGFKRATGDIWITIDSDSEVAPATLRQMVGTFCRNPRVGAVAGNVRVLNKSAGVIPRMLDVSFTYSFDFIRQAQGQVNTVMCTPGALSGYRRSAAEPVLEQWLRQRFLGREANIGEDRAITNLILKHGWLTHFQSEAVVFTNVPTRYAELCKMYLRWARSNVRESIAMSRFIFTRVRPEAMSGARINFCMEFSRLVVAEFCKLVMLWGVAAAPLLFGYNLILGVIAGAMVPAVVHRLRHGGWECLWALPYVCFSLTALSWISLYALCTPHRNGWLTRTLDAPQQQNLLQPHPTLPLFPLSLELLAAAKIVHQRRKCGVRAKLRPDGGV